MSNIVRWKIKEHDAVMRVSKHARNGSNRVSWRQLCDYFNSRGIKKFSGLSWTPTELRQYVTAKEHKTPASWGDKMKVETPIDFTMSLDSVLYNHR